MNENDRMEEWKSGENANGTILKVNENVYKPIQYKDTSGNSVVMCVMCLLLCTT